MRRFVLICLSLVPLLMAARSTPPEVEKPETSPPRNFTIYGESLTITPSSDLSYLVFTGGVRCVTAEMELTSDVLKLDVKTAEVTGGTKLKLPKPKVGEERVVEDPGAVVRSIAAQTEVPKAEFDKRAIQRVSAEGNVRVKGENINLTTGGLVSKDGGNTWSASGRSTISSCDDKGNCYLVSADYIDYTLSDDTAVARGAIDGQYSGGSGEPVQISAESLVLNLKKNNISASTAEVTFDTRLMEHLSPTGAAGKPVPAGQPSGSPQPSEAAGPEANQQDTKLKLLAAELVIRQQSEQPRKSGQVIEATGGITLSGHLGDEGQMITLTADRLTANFIGGNADQNTGATGGNSEQTIRLEATGNPHLSQGSSTFDGQQIVIKVTRDKTVIEVDGDQTARLNVDELKQEAGDDKAETANEKGPPADGEPQVDSE